MNNLHKHNINLSDRQKIKLKVALKNRKNTTIGLKRDQLSGGKNIILLTEDQHKLVKDAIKNNKGVRLSIKYDQLVLNKNGGLLRDILDFAEEIPIVKKVVPYVKKAAPIVKNDVIPIVRNIIDWLEKELKDVSGSGLDKNTLNVVRNHMIKVASKKR